MDGPTFGVDRTLLPNSTCVPLTRHKHTASPSVVVGNWKIKLNQTKPDMAPLLQQCRNLLLKEPLFQHFLHAGVALSQSPKATFGSRWKAYPELPRFKTQKKKQMQSWRRPILVNTRTVSTEMPQRGTE